MSHPSQPSREQGDSDSSFGDPPPVVTMLADHWATVLAYGLLTLGLGLVLAVWPGETLVVVTVLLSIQFLVYGVLRLVAAVSASSVDPGIRALVGLSGALAVVVGLVCLRDPVRTLTVIGLVLGTWWVVSGIIDVLRALISPTRGRRGWDLGTGFVSAAAGAFLLVNPELSLGVLVLVVCAWLFAVGLIAVGTALAMRSLRRTDAPARSLRPDAPPAPAT
jgi:uncharacterized membrane protein HdeD (DUF308 family)